jgi:hypothetical protein
MSGALAALRVVDFGQYVAGRWRSCCWPARIPASCTSTRPVARAGIRRSTRCGTGVGARSCSACGERDLATVRELVNGQAANSAGDYNDAVSAFLAKLNLMPRLR